MQKDKSSLLKELRANASACVMSMAVADGYIKTVIEGDNRHFTDDIVKWLRDGTGAKYFLAKVQETMFNIARTGYSGDATVKNAIGDTIKTLQWAIGLRILPNGSCFAIDERKTVNWDVIQNVDENVRNLMNNIFSNIHSMKGLKFADNIAYISQQINIMMSDIFMARSIWKHKSDYNESDWYMNKSKMLSSFLVKRSNERFGALLESEIWRNFIDVASEDEKMDVDNFYTKNIILASKMVGVCIKDMIISGEIESSLDKNTLQELVDSADGLIEDYMDSIVSFNTDIKWEKDFIDSMECDDE